MKKSVKVLIVILCLIIVGLVGFIVWDKVINKKENTDNTNVTPNNIVTNSNENVDLANTNNTTNQNANNDETKIANEAIKKALENDTWIKNNVISDSISRSLSDMYGNDWYSHAKETIFFAKISTEYVPMYIIGIVDPAASEDYYIVTYKDGNVVINEIPHSDYAFFIFDLNKNVIKEEADFGNPTKYLEYKNNQYQIIAEIDYDEVQVDDGNGNNTNTSLNTTYKINDEIVSADTFKKFEEKYNFEKIETKLTDENIDKFVK